MYLNTLRAHQALGDLCERRGWLAPGNEATPLAGAALCQILEQSTSDHMMHAHIRDVEHEETLMIVAPVVRTSKQSEQNDATLLRNVLQLLVEAVKRSLLHCVMFFSENCASAQLQQIQDVVTSSGSTRFTACNTCFLYIPVLRHPLNQDKEYELLAKDKVRMLIEVECDESIVREEDKFSNVFVSRRHLGGTRWFLQTRIMSSDRYEREKMSWSQNGVQVVREDSESEYERVVQGFLGGDPARVKDLPHMLSNDPCNIVLGGQKGDMVRIRRFREDGNVAYRVIA